MKTPELIAQLAERNDQPAAIVKLILESAFEDIAQSVAAGQSVAIKGFGTFELRERAARSGRNPHNGEPIEIPASKTVGFRAFPALKARVSDSQ